MKKYGPWTRKDSDVLLERRFFTVHSDQVVTPGGDDGVYDWVQAPDLVRVAALTDDGSIYVVEQYHYLPERQMWQLPGGNVDPAEQAAAAAARELHEEVGAQAGRWHDFGAVWPMPGLTTARVHLWLAEQLHLGNAHPEQSEADLLAKPVPLTEAVDAALNGRIGCAASAQLVLAVAATRAVRN